MHRFAWINPGESLPGLSEVPEAGAFAYTFKKGTLEVALKDARFDLQPHDSMESIESDLLHPQGRLYVCMSVCMHAYMHTCMHAYIHTHIHTHSHTYYKVPVARAPVSQATWPPNQVARPATSAWPLEDDPVRESVSIYSI